MLENFNFKEKAIIVPLIVSAVLIILGLIIGDVPILGNLVIISVFICIVPYFILRYMQFLRIKAIEEQFPKGFIPGKFGKFLQVKQLHFSISP